VSVGRPQLEDSTVTELERAAERISFARGYTLRLVDDIDPADWFRMPAGVTHVAWQVGHLAFAQYRLTLLRLRGKAAGDSELLPDEFLRQFGANSTPDPDASRQLPPGEIRAVLDRVHARVLLEVSRFDPARLNEPIDPPHSIAKTKIDALYWCSAHELVHAGQIGLLRRELGHKPLW
jgi:hypothetical protein